ncbi:MAG: sucrase ferredoxin [Dermatophilaceae bacterium]|nr:sucrase ferredoxin [Intrasporangiaceae bacterium]
MRSDRTPEERLSVDSCSVGARARRDPLIGSAPPARGWLLFECPGPWPVTATRLFGALGPEMDRRTLAAGVRPMLVRRPGRADPEAPRSWWFVDSVEGTWMRGEWATTEDVRHALDLVDVARADATARMTPADPMILVCAHAKHDVCCAVRGRPVAARLATRWPELVWECSHLGGDRFAGNIAMLPDSVFYGGLDTSDAEQLVVDHLAGETTLEALRGAGTQTSAGQAAVAELLRREGSRRIADLSVTSVQPVGDGVWEIGLQGRGSLPAHTVLTVERRWREPAQLTCSGLQPKTAAEYLVR